jgi:hypothetical protein
MAAMREAGRSIEPHPFQRLSIIQKAQGMDWGLAAKRVGGQAVV